WPPAHPVWPLAAPRAFRARRGSSAGDRAPQSPLSTRLPLAPPRPSARQPVPLAARLPPEAAPIVLPPASPLRPLRSVPPAPGLFSPPPLPSCVPLPRRYSIALARRTA